MYLLLDAFQAAFTESPSLSLDAMQQFILYCAGQTNQQSLAIVLLSFYLSQFGERETTPSFLVRIMEVEALLSSSDSIIVHCLPYIKGKLSSFFVDALLTSLIGCFQNCSHMYQMARIVSSFFKGRFIPITTRTLLLAITAAIAITANARRWDELPNKMPIAWWSQVTIRGRRIRRKLPPMSVPG